MALLRKLMTTLMIPLMQAALMGSGLGEYFIVRDTSGAQHTVPLAVRDSTGVLHSVTKLVRDSSGTQHTVI